MQAIAAGTIATVAILAATGAIMIDCTAIALLLHWF
jgi:hypothetical protein